MSGDLSALTKESEGAGVDPAMQDLETSARNIRSQTELAANMAKAVAPAYGTLAAKAEEFVDKHAPALTAAADKVNQMNIKATEALSDGAAATLGAVEGGMSWYDKAMELLGIFTSLKILVWGEKAKKMFVGLKNVVVGFMKWILKLPGPLTRIPNIFGDMFKGADKLANVLGSKLPGKLGFLVKKIPVIGGIVSGLMNAWDSLTQAFASFTDGNYAEGIGHVFGAIFNFADGFLSAVPGFFVWIGQLFGWVDEDVDANSLISSLLSPIFDGLMGKWLEFIENFEGFGSDFVNILKQIPQFVWEVFTDFLGLVPILIDSVLEAFGFDAFATDLHNDLVTSLEDAFGAAIDWIYDFLGIASPSQVFMDIGTSMMDGLISMLNADSLMAAAQMMVDALLFPFTSLGSLLMDLVGGAFDLVPDSIKSFMGFETDSTSDTAAKLAGATTGGVAAKTGAAAGNNNSDPYVINLAMNLDGKEIDKKVVNVVGGIAKQATL